MGVNLGASVFQSSKNSLFPSVFQNQTQNQDGKVGAKKSPFSQPLQNDQDAGDNLSLVVDIGRISMDSLTNTVNGLKPGSKQEANREFTSLNVSA